MTFRRRHPKYVMSIETQIYARLSADATLTGLVSGRIYPTQPDENTALPFLTYAITFAEPQQATTGNSSTVKYGVDVTVYGKTIANVNGINTAVQSLLNNWRGGGVQCGLSKKNRESVHTTSLNAGPGTFCVVTLEE